MKAALLVATSLAACTYPEKELVGPFDCLGAPPPTGADAVIRLQGQVVSASSEDTPLGGISLTLQDRNMNAIDGPKVTTANGNFTFSLNTGGQPIDRVYLRAEGTDRVTTFHVPERPLTEDILQIKYGVISTMQRDSLALGALGMPFTAGTGGILMNITDCNNKRLSGVTVTSVPAGTVRYFDGVMPSMTATATDAGGVAMVANLPPGMVTLTARAGTMTFPSRTYLVVANTFVQTVIVP